MNERHTRTSPCPVCEGYDEMPRGQAVRCSGYTVEMEDGRKTTLPLGRVDALSVAAIDGLADRPVIVIDLALNWLDLPEAPLKIIRIRSDGFDPRRLHSAPSAIDALRGLLERIVASGATPLPTPEAVCGNPFTRFTSLSSYEQSVLMAKP